MKKLKIGIAANILIMDSGMMPGIYRAYVNNDYVESLEKAGCIPVMLPVLSDIEDVKAQVEGLDGIVLSGGWDIDPFLYGEQPLVQQGFTMREVDRFYLAVIQAGDTLSIPIFGICKGMQAINIAFGGTLYQDIGSQMKTCFQHVQQAPRYDATHKISIEKGSFLESVLGKEAMVNSFHHQSIKTVASGFRITARAGDGVVESIERDSGSFICGVQWHPEMMAKHDNKIMLQLFQAFAGKCR
mgnify:CR=1 FL=1